jgi:hypothetical protein
MRVFSSPRLQQLHARGVGSSGKAASRAAPPLSPARRGVTARELQIARHAPGSGLISDPISSRTSAKACNAEWHRGERRLIGATTVAWRGARELAVTSVTGSWRDRRRVAAGFVLAGARGRRSRSSLPAYCRRSPRVRRRTVPRARPAAPAVLLCNATCNKGSCRQPRVQADRTIAHLGNAWQL